MMAQETVADRLARVQERIASAAHAAGRQPAEITLVGASKTVDPARVRAAVLAGLGDVGENYVQEAQGKVAALRDDRQAAPRWHLIGHLQSNKARQAAELFDIIQSLDSDRLAGVLARHAGALGKRLRVLLEVDYTGLPDRTALAPDVVPATVEAVLGLPALELAGLMTVPALGLAAAETQAVFARLRQLREDLAARYPEASWRELSMGMSEDFELAIAEGATMVRLGRAIFGERP
jgi:PLP dependent protein